MKIIYGAVLVPLYLIWIIYRALIKRDLRKNLDDFYGLTFLIVVWIGIYYWIFSKEINHFICGL